MPASAHITQEKLAAFVMRTTLSAHINRISNECAQFAETALEPFSSCG